MTIYDAVTQEQQLGPIDIVELNATIENEIEYYAGFDNAQSEIVKNAEAAAGVFQQDTQNPDFFICFDPNGNYIGIIKLGEQASGFGFGIKDSNWTLGNPD